MREVIIKSKIVGREGAIGGGKPIAFPDLSAYALRSDFIRLESSFNEFLEGDDTDNVINRWKELEAFLNNISEDYNLLSLLNGKADKATTLSGYGITDAYTKTNVDDLLKSYVTLGGKQTITGEKNFTGGLKINGSPIYYDTDKKYWKLEGDLLVTGGVTMYGSDSSFTPSTIMDAILYDSATLGINSNGQLYVKGGTSGGGLDITALQNYLTQNSYLNITSGDNRYLKLSGGTINGTNPYPLVINTTETQSGIQFLSNNDLLGVIINGGEYGTALINFKGKYRALGIDNDGNAYTTIDYNNTKGILLHSANYSSYALPLSGGTLTNTLTIDNSNVGLILHRSGQSTPYIRFGQDANNEWGELGVYNDGRLVFWPLVSSQGGYNQWNTVWHSGNDGSDSGLDADLLDGKHADAFALSNKDIKLDSFVNQIGYGFKSQGWYDSGAAIMFGANSSYYMLLQGASNGSEIYLRANYMNNGSYVGWKDIAFTDSNVASATKLQTARTIWGQSFDGTGNVTGQLNITTGSNVTLTYGTGLLILGTMASAHIAIDTNDIQAKSNGTTASTLYLNDYGGNVSMCGNGGNVGIGTTSPVSKCDINGLLSIRLESSSAKQSSLNLMNTSSDLWQLSARYGTSDNGNFNIYYYNGSTWANPISINKNGNLLATGAMTFYSMRKLKNVVDERGLSLNELSTIKPTRYTWKDGRDNRLHFGGIADDIEQVLPEVVYKTSDGTLTMDYGNAAFAVASSLIKPVVDHEKRIAMLEEENKQLRQEVERLKSA